MRACRKYAFVMVSSKVSASLSSSTTRGLTGCTGCHLLSSVGCDRASLAHQFAQRGDASAADPAGTGLAGDVVDAAGAVGDGLDHVAVCHDRAVAHVHRWFLHEAGGSTGGAGRSTTGRRAGG